MRTQQSQSTTGRQPVLVHSFSVAARDTLQMSTHPATQTEVIMDVEKYSNALRVGRYLRLAKRIANTKEPAFNISPNKQGSLDITPTWIGEQHYLFVNPPTQEEVEVSLPHKIIHPIGDLFLKKLQAPNWLDKIRPDLPEPCHVEHDGRTVAEHINEFVDKFRAQANSQKMAKILKDWEAVTNDRYYGTVDYLNSLWEFGPSRMLFIRVDLGIRVEHQELVHVFAMRDYFETLLNNKRGKPSLFKHCVGIIWRLEYEDDKSYHYHCLFILDGSKVQQDINYADAFGQYWQNNITDGEGTYWNCNSSLNEYRRRGIGMIDHTDLQKRQYLMQDVIPYLTAIDDDIRVVITQDAEALGYDGKHLKVRTFGRGKILTARKSNRGRPRKENCTDCEV